MKTRIPILLLTALLIVQNALAQTWHQPLNAGMVPAAATGRLEDVYFTSYTTGFAVDLRGNIYKTTNAARTWQVRNYTSGNAPIGFRSVEFLADGMTGLAGSLDAPGCCSGR